jgi:hypothetical protein
VIHHSDIIANFAKIYQPKVYVELGLHVGETWHKVLSHAEEAFGVDIVDRSIQGGKVYVQTTNEFFQHFDREINMAFIDADHSFESVLHDFENVSKLLHPQGVIILHDTDPESDHLFDRGYCGDSYRIVEFLQVSEEYNSVTIPVSEAGLTVVTKKNNTRVHGRRNANLRFGNRPYSPKHNSWVDDFTIKQLIQLSPASVVDIGCGDGFYGKLCKHVLGDRVTVTGIDANPNWYSHCETLKEYSEVICGCVIELLPQLKGELVIAGDVLEHLEETDMRRVVKHLCSSFKYVIINSPLGFQPQHHPDIWENHRCGLDRKLFDGYFVVEYNESFHMGNEMFNILIARKH